MNPPSIECPTQISVDLGNQCQGTDRIQIRLKIKGVVPSIQDLVMTNDYCNTFTYSQTNSTVITSPQDVNTTISIRDLFGNTGKRLITECISLLQQIAYPLFHL